MEKAILTCETHLVGQSIPIKAPMSHRTITDTRQWLPYTTILIYKGSSVA